MLDPFPFSEPDWSRVSQAARELVNATLMEDEVLCAVRSAVLMEILDSLRETYGEHPVLLETEADFLEEPVQRIALYRRAIDLAVREGIPTYSMRIALARVLVDGFGDKQAALCELASCADEVTREADEWDRSQWSELMRACSRKG